LPRGEKPKPITSDVRIDGLERVVAGGHRGLLQRARDALAGGVVLRLLETGLVPLVEADDPGHLRIALRHLGGELREQLDAVRGVDEAARLRRVDVEDQVDAAGDRLRDGAVEESLVGDRRRVGGIPEHRQPVLVQPEVVEGGEEAGAAVVGVLAGVVCDAEGGGAGGGAHEHQGSRKRGDRRNRLHIPVLGGSGGRPYH
jgi:hypothetical protein